MAAQFITVDFLITQYISQIGGRGQAFSLPPGTIKIGPWIIDSEVKTYFLMVVLLTLCVMIVANLLRSKVGRAWIAIRDNDIAAETLGINIIWYKLLNFFVAGFIAGLAGAFWVSNTAAHQSGTLPLVLVSLVGRRYPHRWSWLHSWCDLRFYFHGVGNGIDTNGCDRIK